MEFDSAFIEEDFVVAVRSQLSPICYDRLNKEICLDCAVEEYEAGRYVEECECCGVSFNPEDELMEFQSNFEYGSTEYNMWDNGIYCARCAIKKITD